MSSDTETFANQNRRKPRYRNGTKYCESEGDDFPSMMTDMIKGINWKVSIFLFVLMIFIFSDLYIELFLNSIQDAVEGDCPTTKGTMIQIISVVVGYIVLDLLVQGKFL